MYQHYGLRVSLIAINVVIIDSYIIHETFHDKFSPSLVILFSAVEVESLCLQSEDG